MAHRNAFDWLRATITVAGDAPSAWEREGLHVFYQNPTDARWETGLSRALFNESQLFWLVLASGYVANAVEHEWMRVLEFERTGSVPAEAAPIPGEFTAGAGDPFSVQELVECWARYWDVHTRTPSAIIEQERIAVPPGMMLRPRRGYHLSNSGVLDTGGEPARGYTPEVFDLVMRSGPRAEEYSAPYRWLLEQPGMTSASANILFPILAFHALGSPQPVDLMRVAVERALRSKALAHRLESSVSSITLAWLMFWELCTEEAVEPARRNLRLPEFTAGWEIISRGQLASHPIYAAYKGRLRSLFNLLRLGGPPEPSIDAKPDAIYNYALIDLPRRDPRVLFAFPGQPAYRLELGSRLPPPRVRFNNFTVLAEAIPGAAALARLGQVMGQPVADDTSLKTAFDAFDPRMERFANAIAPAVTQRESPGQERQ